MKKSLKLTIYSLTIFLSAFLIFSLQPFFSKMILPLLGGTSSVWNTAMVFFQAVLLAGYTYAHLSSKYLKLRHQIILHIFLLILCTVFLPITLRENNVFTKSDPILWQLMLMFGTIGGPYFVLSASAPLLQKWFGSSDHEKSDNPYFLYAISNIGSMGSLLAYPVLIERLMTLTLQGKLWTYGYYLLTVLIVMVAAYVWNYKIIPEDDSNEIKRIRFSEKLLWIFYAFIPSSLMLGITTLITTDLASVPLFWVVPLAIYLGTFIIAFSERQFLTAGKLRLTALYIICLLMYLFMTNLNLGKVTLISFYLISFYILAQYAHCKLFDLRPNTKNLTIFYLYTSLGGVLGGVFNGILAPKLFTVPAELCIPLIMLAVLNIRKIDLDSVPKFFSYKIFRYLLIPVLTVVALVFNDPGLEIIFGFIFLLCIIYSIKNPVLFAWNITITLLLFPPLGWNLSKNLLFRERNYFGILSIKQDGNIRRFLHGTTLHGAQPLNDADKLVPITYYHPMGPVGDIFALLNLFPFPQKVAVLGLGVGSVACYKAPERSFDFYEIDPNVVKLAEDRKYFTYLKDCGSPYSVIVGDARLKIAEQEDKKYDLVFVDTFSSDNIPVHIMTKEAFEIYFKKIKENGILSIHISNRFLELRPVVSSIAKELGLEVKIKEDRRNEVPGSNIPYFKSTYVIMSKSKNSIARLDEHLNWFPYEGKAVQPWTDEYVNILSTIKTGD